jgi:ankyrin repeat protein
MMFAAHNGHADVVKILIDAGADAHTKNACVMLRIIMNMTTN